MAMRRSIPRLGGGQVLLSSLLIFPVGLAFGLNWNSSLIITMALSLSSTTIALQLLKENNLLSTHTENSAVSTLLFQNLA